MAWYLAYDDYDSMENHPAAQFVDGRTKLKAQTQDEAVAEARAKWAAMPKHACAGTGTYPRKPRVIFELKLSE